MIGTLRVLVVLVSVAVGMFAPYWVIALLTVILFFGSLVVLSAVMATRALFGRLDNGRKKENGKWQFFVITSLFTFYPVIWLLSIIR